MHNFISIPNLYSLFLKTNQSVCTDTRNLIPNSIFFALKGTNFDANEFAENAINLGCAYSIVDNPNYLNHPNIFLVENVLIALQELANYHRKQLTIPVLAITGSNGKTTSKELIYCVLSKKYKTHATFGNLNNHIGVPLTLLGINKTHQFAIIEMGANHQGEIELLCKIAEPNFGLITNIGKAHLEGFGGIEGVKKGKSELYKYIKSKKRKIFINGDDPVLISLAIDIEKISYGLKQTNNIIGINNTKSEMVSLTFRSEIEKNEKNQSLAINTNIIGTYNFINCLAAVCVGKHFMINDDLIKQALENYFPNNNRSQLIKTQNNTIILDAYNANPNSIKVALENFSQYKNQNHLILLGDMFELGIYSKDEHQKVLNLLNELNFSEAILVGEEFYKLDVGPFIKFKTTNECKDYLINNKKSDYIVLIKGSRGMRMETLQEIL